MNAVQLLIISASVALFAVIFGQASKIGDVIYKICNIILIISFLSILTAIIWIVLTSSSLKSM